VWGELPKSGYGKVVKGEVRRLLDARVPGESLGYGRAALKS